jgi:cytochrome c-type biogenesis protein CcmF
MLENFKIGDAGHLFVIVSFITSAVAAYAYWKSTLVSNQLGLENKETLSWKRFARGAFAIHAFTVIGIVSSLFYIIYNHRYEYYYAWDHSSNDLPIQYMISCFWEGQEGSFLLWIFWQVILGLILIKVNQTWEAPLMAVFSLVQAFLASMIVGVVIPYLNVKIGSSPFILFKEQMHNLPVFQADPNYVPKDGSGLNALLQNYWMVIHPPTLFLGFAATLVPFAYCIAGLWQGKYKEWIRPALPWTLFGGLILGTGILMGGYWAYETLNFGGYWNWDPVENAVYVPWLVLVGAFHTMITYRSSGKALKASIILVIATFVLVLYSTFLTRSGILGSASVHSFTDLGLSGQLLIYLLAFLFLSIWMSWKSWKQIPSTEEEASIYSREFWIFIGVTILSLAAFQVTATTSIPVYNKIMGLVGLDLKLAPPAEPIKHYNNWQLWFSVGIAILSGLGQFFWWKKVDKEKLRSSLAVPFIAALLISSLVIFIGEVSSVSYIILLTASIFTIVANLIILSSVIRNSFKLSGGAIAHIGIGLMLIGIVFSAGYSKVISKNISGTKLFNDQNENADNVMLQRGQPSKMDQYTLTYQGICWEAKGIPGFVSEDDLIFLDEKDKAVARKPLLVQEQKYFNAGDTLTVHTKNNYYKVLFENPEKDESFTLYPRVQRNDQMGFVVSPDIQRFLARDLYSYISYSSDLDENEKEWSAPEDMSAKIGDTLFFDDYIAILDSIEKQSFYPGVQLDKNGGCAKAKIRVLGKYNTYIAEPAFIWEKDKIGFIPDVIKDLGMLISIKNVDMQPDGHHVFHFTVRTTEKDYIILKTLQKPMINILWIGTLLLVIGLFIAIVRRYSEFAKMRDKGQE